MRVTPPFWYAVFWGCLGGTQYAKGRYAIHKNPVISYADMNIYFKKVQFSSRNTKNVTNKVKYLYFSRARFAGAVWGYLSNYL